MKTDYYVFDPNGNVTVMVLSSVPVNKQAVVTNHLLKIEKQAEQVGFISKAEDNTIKLRMSGGEFCGNAAMASGAFYALKHGISKSKISVIFDGSKLPVAVETEKDGNNSFSGNVLMPPPLSITERAYILDGTVYNLPTVEYKNISHIICEETIDRKAAEKAVKKWCTDNGLKALGIMFADFKAKSLIPLVYVNESNTLYWESSCASGTAAVGEYLFSKNKNIEQYTFSEPKGKLSVKKEENGMFLFGNVKYIEHKSLDIQEVEL